MVSTTDWVLRPEGWPLYTGSGIDIEGYALKALALWCLSFVMAECSFVYWKIRSKSGDSTW